MQSLDFKYLFDELKRRRVFRVATLYVIVFWPLIQLVDIISPALGWSDAIMRYLVTAFFGGLPFALVLAWIFDLDKDGLRIDDGQPHASVLGSKTELGIVGMLALVVLVLFVVQQQMDTDTVPLVETPEVRPPVGLRVAQDSVAVLPFEVFSAKPEDQYFSDGLTEELLNVLSRIKDLKVAARTSSFAYKGVRKNVQEIGRALGVANILQGSVRRNDIENTIRVTAQLIDVSSGTQLWSQTFNHQFTDVFRIQDDISAAVASHLKGTLLNATPLPHHRLSGNPEAMIAFGMGQRELAKRSEVGLQDAVRYFRRAIESDPNYSLAWTGLADAYTLQANYGFQPSETVLAEAEKAVNQALALDPELGMAWASKGLMLEQLGQRQEARVALEKAIKLNPSYAMAFMWYASLLEDKDAKLEYYEKALSLDPKSAVAAFNVANLYDMKGMEAQAMQMISNMVEADPYYAGAYKLMGRINARRGRIGEAIRNLETAYDLQADPQLALELSNLFVELGQLGQSDEWFANVGEVHPGMQAGVDWTRLGRYVAASDSSTVQKLLTGIAERQADDPASRRHKILALYFKRDFSKALELYDQLAPSSETAEYNRYMSLDREVSIAVADMLARSGRLAAAQTLADQTTASINESIKGRFAVDPGNYYRLARLAAITGQLQQALVNLQRAVDEGWRAGWVLDFDPALANLQSETLFRQLVGAMDLRMQVIRDQFLMEAEFAANFGR